MPATKKKRTSAARTRSTPKRTSARLGTRGRSTTTRTKTKSKTKKSTALKGKTTGTSRKKTTARKTTARRGVKIARASAPKKGSRVNRFVGRKSTAKKR